MHRHAPLHRCLRANRLVFLDTPAPFTLDSIDWQPAQMSKLWRYNLHYFDYLQLWINQEDTPDGAHPSQGDFLIEHWIAHNPYPHENAWEPYPTSLRIINWIKYFQAKNPNTLAENWLHSLYQQGHFLSAHIEWHIDANHLLKNIIALVIWSHYFNDAFAQQWRTRSCVLLAKLCAEQFFPDGGHYERSPMYHFILIHHLLDVYNCLQYSTASTPRWLNDTLNAGLNYCQIIVKPDGHFPLLKDSAQGIAPSLSTIMSYAEELGLKPTHLSPKAFFHLQQSGYFIVKSAEDYILFDTGKLSPSHQPGHAHCDALHVEITWRGRDIFTDSGVFNYVASSERHYARSVRAHNTLAINGQEQHHMWDAFRVAERGHARNIITSATYCSAEFYPYFSRNCHMGHKRSLEIIPTGGVKIVERLFGAGKTSADIFWHLAPGLVPRYGSGAQAATRQIEIRDEQDLLVATIELQDTTAQNLDLICFFTQSEYFPAFGERQLRHCVVFQLRDLQLPAQFSYSLLKAPLGN
ncbi:MAG: heparinase II/III family protein [Marinagarivorans sp.]